MDSYNKLTRNTAGKVLVTGLVAAVLATTGCSKKENKTPFADPNIDQKELSEKMGDKVFFDRSNVPAEYADMAVISYDIPTNVEVQAIRWRAGEDYDMFVEEKGWKATGKFDYCVDPVRLCNYNDCQTFVGKDGKATHIVQHNPTYDTTHIIEPFNMKSMHCATRTGKVWLKKKQNK